MWKKLAIASIFLLQLQEVICDEKEEKIQNVQVIHLIDITTYIVKSKYKITFKNMGKEPTKKYIFELNEGTAYASFEDVNNASLEHDIDSSKNNTVYTVHLKQPLMQKEEYMIKIKLILPSKLRAATKFSRYNEEHRFLWRGNSVFYSPYFTENYRFMFMTDPVFNKNIHMSAMYDSSVKNMYIYYAKNVAPLQYKELNLTFTSPLPLIRVVKLSRCIFVSQFGKIQVQDEVVVENAGPPLLGPFFNMESDYWMYTHVPKTSENIKFFDILGNNSKTFIVEKETHKTIKFIPRYSLRQGGWKSTYILQYDISVYEYVFTDGMDYYLKIRVMDHILNDVVVKDADVKIVLPDGANVLSVIVPVPFEKKNNSYCFTSLCVLGRPSVNVEGKMLLEDHINDIIIKYQFSLVNFLLTPLFLILLIESVFFVIIFWRKYFEKFSL